ncbi:MAG: hypothetical protein JOZ41_04700 [Chloroflexi bacterium]|nr:hypothetical protein [Chloroflexota bacterium]
MGDPTGLETSSHYTEELSALLLCASAQPVHLEKHAFALDACLQHPQQVVGGRVRPTSGPGTDLRFNEEAMGPYRVV